MAGSYKDGDRKPGSGSGLEGGTIFLGVSVFVLALACIIWLGGAIATILTRNSGPVPKFGVSTFGDLILKGPGAVWQGVNAILITVCIVLIFAATLGVIFGAMKLVGSRFKKNNGTGLANKKELMRFTMAERAAESVRLRPRTLEGVDPTKLRSQDVGAPIGSWNGQKLFSGWEDVALAIMAPRSGKTSAIGVPQIVSAPGPVIVTSNKSDIYSITVTKRKRDHPNSTIWLFDPQQVVLAEPTWFWNPLGHVKDFDSALELAGMFLAKREADDGGGGNAEFFESSGRNYLAYLLLAAALPTKKSAPLTLAEVDSWLDERRPMDAVFRLQAAKQDHHSKALSAMIDGPDETIGGIIAVARDAAVALKSEKILEWVVPGRGKVEFSPRKFIHSEDSLYLMSNDKSASAAAPLIAAFTSRVFDVGAEEAAKQYRQRLDPPMVAVLDEAANICKIPGLPGGYSHYGSRGICVMTIFQNPHQPVRVWGKNSWQEMWAAATIKLIGPGMDDATFAEDISKLVGEVDVDVKTLSKDKDGGNSSSTTVRQERILHPSDIRTIESGKMLLLATATTPAMLDQDRYYFGRYSEELAVDEKNVANIITERAQNENGSDYSAMPALPAEIKRQVLPPASPNKNGTRRALESPESQRNPQRSRSLPEASIEKKIEQPAKSAQSQKIPTQDNIDPDKKYDRKSFEEELLASLKKDPENNATSTGDRQNRTRHDSIVDTVEKPNEDEILPASKEKIQPPSHKPAALLEFKEYLENELEKENKEKDENDEFLM